jgi:DNA-binding NtrC family response regulator
MARKIKLLIVDDETRFLQTLAKRLELRDFEVTACGSGQEAIELASKTDFDLALVDLKMPGLTGEQVLEALKREHPLTEVVILTGHGSIPSAVQCTQQGAYNYLQKPCETDEMMEVLKNAYQKRLQRKLQIDQEKMEKLLNLALGESPLRILQRLREIDQGKE